MAYYAGPHTMTWGGDSLGDSTSGIRIRINQRVIPVRNDGYGPAGIADVLYGGRTVLLTFEALEINRIEKPPGTVDADTAKVNWGEDNFGKLPDAGLFAIGDSIAKVLIATAVNRTNSLSMDITANKAILIDPIEMLWSASLPISIPLTFLLLPYDASGDTVNYVPTTAS